MYVKLKMNCVYGNIGDEVNIPDDILKKYPVDGYEKKEVVKAKNKAILEKKSTKLFKK